MIARTLAAGFAPFLLCVALAAGAGAPPGPSRGAALPDDDRTFLLRAAQAGLAEIELGKLAQRKGGSAGIKRLGARMAADYRKFHEALGALAKRKAVALPSALDRESAARAEAMQGISGAPFDREYASYVVQDHREAVAEFESAAKQAKDRDLRALARKRLPALKRHLEMARSAAPAAVTGRAP